MTKSKNIEAQPLFNTEKQKNEGLCDTSWVIVSSSTTKGTEVFYFNPEVSPEYFDHFESFARSVMDDFYCAGDNVKTVKSVSENVQSITGYAVGQAQASVSNIYKGGITKEKIQGLVSEIESEVSNLASKGAYETKDDYEYHKDPHKYYGVNKKDFF